MIDYKKKYLKYKKKYLKNILIYKNNNNKYFFKINDNLSFYQNELLNFKKDINTLINYNVITLLVK
tara:strand:+ start:2053 stop:2250 length:198 start_codon:yes stop_codon:yes gene_type:complete